MNKLQFTCRNCGSNRLAYQKYVKCITPVFLQADGSIQEGLPQFDVEDSLCTLNGYICLDCMTLIKHCGCHMETDVELKAYLSLDPKMQEEQQKEHDRVEKSIMQESDGEEMDKATTEEFPENDGELLGDI